MSDITFSTSLIATNPPPTCEDDPVYHLLPPEPIILRPLNRSQNEQSSSYEEGTMKFDYADITLGNSPQFPKGLQVQRPTHSISSFNQKIRDSHTDKYLVVVNPPQKERKSPTQSKTQSRAKELIFSHIKEQIRLPSKESSFQRGVSDSRTYKEGSRISRNSNSTVRGEESSFQNQIKNPRQQSLYVGNEIKKKFTNKRGNIQKDSILDPSILVDKIRQLQSEIQEIQNINKTLSLQLQMSRERLKTSLSQNSLLQDKNNQLLQAIESYKQGESVRRSLQREVAELGKLNELFCQEIDQQKEQIVKYEEKNEESLKLLQKLNENITKKEEKLHKQLEEQTYHFNKIGTDKRAVEMELSQANEKLKMLEDDQVSKMSTIEELTHQNQELISKINSLQQQNQIINKRLQQQQSEIKRLEGQLRDKIAFLEQKLAEFQKQLKSSETYNNQLLHELNDKQQEMTQLVRAYQQQASTLAKTNQQEMTALAKNHQQQRSKLAKALDEKRKQAQESQKQYTFQRKELTVSYEELINQFKQRIDEKERENQQLNYFNKELEMKLRIVTGAKDKSQTQIKDLKQEKRIIYTEKQQLKNDIKQLLDTNEKQFKDLQRIKQKEIQLNEQISNNQKEIIQLEQRTSQYITNISNKDIQIAKLMEKVQKQVENSENLGLQIDNRNKLIAELHEKLKRYQKMIILYKQELSRMKDNKEAQWQQMKALYEEQITTLQNKLRYLLEQDSKKNTKSIKKQTQTISRQAKEQRTIIQPIRPSFSQQSA